MKLLYDKNQKAKLEFQQFESKTVSTLLIPQALLIHIENKFGKKYQLDDILSCLISKYKKFIASSQIRPSKSFKLKFQEEGLNLIPKKFRPENKDWMELGIIAYGLGYSRCWLFSYLLELEFSLMGEFLELPELMEALATLSTATPKNIWQLTNKNTAFLRILHFRE
ncbi:MAG: DUF1564 family protein [Leptospiraceae bacterium]|nr:DUF1564 family protein [Leptospiraceae bacterium]